MDAKIARLHVIKERFERLSGEYIAALDDRQFVRSHEILADICSLLDDPQTQALFPEILRFGGNYKDGEEPRVLVKVVPTRTLTRAFFDELPKGMEEQVGAALPKSNPFGEYYPDPHWPKGSKGYPSLKRR